MGRLWLVMGTRLCVRNEIGDGVGIGYGGCKWACG